MKSKTSSAKCGNEHSSKTHTAKTNRKSSKGENRISDPCYSNNATTVPSYTYKASPSSQSSHGTVAVSIPSGCLTAATTPSLTSYNSNSSHSPRSKSSSSTKSKKFSNSSNHQQSSSAASINQFKSVVLGLAVACALAFAVLSQSKTSLSSIETLKSSLFASKQQRYIRSVSPQTEEDSSGLITRVQNGVTEMYNSHFKNTIQNVFGSVFSEGATHTAGANLAKNGKLHYIPSSAYDPTKTAHHVLEGAGYRLNIPSYVQSVPNMDSAESTDIESDVSQNDNEEISTQSASQDQQQIQLVNPEKFDQAILQKQIIKPRSFAAAPQPLTENGIVKQAIFNPNDVPVSSVDPILDNIIQDMLAKRQERSNGFQAVKQLNTTEIFSRDSELGQCSPSNNVVFAKTHKTGGTTITNMLLRHAEKQKLNVALPVEYHWELAGYPAPFEEKLITPKQEQYDVMCHHMRFNKTKIEKMVNPLADYFTILRDPVTNFESSFGFFKDYPFTDWLDNNRNLDDFVNNAEQYYNKSTPWYFRAKNYMSFDLGFDHENNTDAYIRHAISKMEEEFKFVMITDRYEESMILLKNMLCLDYDDIVYLPLKVRTDNDRKRISSETAAKIKKWNRLDTAIYEYFSQRFEQMTIDYGKDKLASEVQILREKLKDVEARCVEDYDSQSLKPWIKRIKLRKPSGQKCQRLVWGEVKYADYLRQLQYSQLSEEEYTDQPKLDDKIELMQQVQKTILGDTPM